MREIEKNMNSLRTLAALFVISVHICSPILTANNNVFNAAFSISSSIQIFTRVAVPIFVLISGRYLLSNWDEKSVISFYKKRMSRVILPFIFSIIIYGFYRIFIEKSATITSYIKDTLYGVPYEHLWFFYMIIGLYAITPILYKIKNKFSAKVFRNLGYILLVFAMISEMAQGMFQLKYIPIFYFVDYLGYFITGYSLKDYKPKFNPNNLLYIYIILSMMRGGCALLLQANGNMLWQCFHLSSNPLGTLSAIYLYLYFSNLRLERYRLADISKYTLGIYVIHDMFVHGIMYNTHYVLTGVLFIDIFLYVIIIFALSLLTIRLMWSLSITRKLIK